MIMLALIRSAATGMPYMSVEAWYVLSALLAPIGYVVQDVVADAMTVEAVPKVDADGRFHDERDLKQMHTTMQMLGRMAIVGGRYLRVAGQYRTLPRRQRHVGSGAGRHLRRYLLPRPPHSGDVGARRGPGSRAEAGTPKPVAAPGIQCRGDPPPAGHAGRNAARQLVAPGRQPRVCGLHSRDGAEPGAVRPGKSSLPARWLSSSFS